MGGGMGMGYMGMNVVVGGVGVGGVVVVGGRNFSNDFYVDYNGFEGGEGMVVDQVVLLGLEFIFVEFNQQIFVCNVSIYLYLIVFMSLLIMFQFLWLIFNEDFVELFEIIGIVIFVEIFYFGG